MKDAYYFSHDANAHEDEKILYLLADYHFEGYGIYWLLCELMFSTDNTALKHDLIKGLSHGYNIDISRLSKIIADAISIGLFKSDGKYFWSESLRMRKLKWKQKQQKWSEAGKKGMAHRWAKDKDLDKVVITSDNNLITSKGKESKGKEIKERKEIYKEKKNFIPPALEEVQAYCLERGNSINPDKWLNHYQAKGWMIGRNKMKDWKAAVRTWERDDPTTPSKPKSFLDMKI